HHRPGGGCFHDHVDVAGLVDVGDALPLPRAVRVVDGDGVDVVRFPQALGDRGGQLAGHAGDEGGDCHGPGSRWAVAGSVDAPVVAGPLLLPEDELLDLAGRGLGQLVDELHLVRRLVVGETVPDVGDDVLL